MKRISRFFGLLIYLSLLIVLPGFCDGAAVQYITVQNGNFYRAGQPWFPYGLNYWPYYAMQFPISWPENWLGSDYNPTPVESDLTTLASMGVNCISTQGSTEAWAPANLPDFLTRCRNHGLQVILAFPLAYPMNPIPSTDPETALDQIIPVLQLDQRPEILSYDIAWEPNLGTWTQKRSAWDGAWSRFISREFGSIAAANLVFQPHQLATQRPDLPASGLFSLTMPVRARLGIPVNCTIIMQNLGETWNQGQVFLLPLFGDGLPSSSTPIGLQETSVTMGNQGTFSFSYNPTSPGRKRLRLTLATKGTGNTYTRFGTLIEWEVEVISSGIPVVRTITAPPPVLGCLDDELYPSPLPEEPPLPATPPPAIQDLLVNAYRRCLDTETATRFGRVCRRIRQLDPNHLISCRQGSWGNGNPKAVGCYGLDLVSTAAHFDFQGLENYYLNQITTLPLTESDYILAGMATDQAYSRWATNGKPVIWSEAGFLYEAPDNNPPIPPREQAQADYYTNFINALLQTNGNGVQFWWWPGGLRTTLSGASEDWGVTNPDGTFRAAATVMANLAAQATSPRTIPPETVTGTPVDLLADARGYAWIYCTHQQEALAAVTAVPPKGYALNGKGAGTDSSSTTWVGGLPEYLSAEISKVELQVGETGSWFEVRDGMTYAVPAGQKIYCRAKVVNMGDATWLTNVAFAANPRQAGFLNFAPQYLADNAPRLTKVEIPAFKMTDGLSADHPVQFQMNAPGVCWITGSVQIHLAVYQFAPTWLSLLLLD